jgi:hypothetical protein
MQKFKHVEQGPTYNDRRSLDWGSQMNNARKIEVTGIQADKVQWL